MCNSSYCGSVRHVALFDKQSAGRCPVRNSKLHARTLTRLYSLTLQGFRLKDVGLFVMRLLQKGRSPVSVSLWTLSRFFEQQERVDSFSPFLWGFSYVFIIVSILFYFPSLQAYRVPFLSKSKGFFSSVQSGLPPMKPISSHSHCVDKFLKGLSVGCGVWMNRCCHCKIVKTWTMNSQKSCWHSCVRNRLYSGVWRENWTWPLLQSVGPQGGESREGVRGTEGLHNGLFCKAIC